METINYFECKKLSKVATKLLLQRYKGEALMEMSEKIDTQEYEVCLMIDGKEIPFIEAMSVLDKRIETILGEFQERVENRAKEMVREKFSDLMDSLNAVGDKIEDIMDKTFTED